MQPVKKYMEKVVILTTGTYMKGQILRGSSKHTQEVHMAKNLP